jgi:ribulose-5-phosphate 4-epimerase/fuculose-1-phosphate aldolase
MQRERGNFMIVFPPGRPRPRRSRPRLCRQAYAVLLANHGPVAAGSNVDAAVNAIEEPEETAKLYLLLRCAKTRYLTHAQVQELVSP